MGEACQRQAAKNAIELALACFVVSGTEFIRCHRSLDNRTQDIYNPLMSTSTLSDTHPDVEQLQLDLMRQAPAWRKLELACQMYESMKLLALSGLRQRYPQAGDAELRRRLADLLLGAELAEQAYGPLQSRENVDAA